MGRGQLLYGSTLVTNASTRTDAADDDGAPRPTHGHGSIATEIHGVLTLVLVVAGTAAVALAALPAVDPPRGVALVVATLSATLAAALHAGFKSARAPWAFRHRDGLVLALACVASALAWFHATGQDLAPAIALVMTMSYVGFTGPLRSTLACAATAGVGYAALAWTADRPLLGIAFVELGLGLSALLAFRLRAFFTRQVDLLAQAVRVSAHAEMRTGWHRRRRPELRIGDASWFTGRQVGSYRLGVLAGAGAMGEVYQATHVDTGEPAAVKLLHPNTLQCSELVWRFLREEDIMTRLHGQHVVQVYEVGDESSPLPYFAMELLDGEDLSRSLARRGRLSVEETVRLAREVGDGLDAAHTEGVVHRDLKPQNLFLDRRCDVWKILDFGVSRLLAAGATLSQGEVVGTPPYMAPEQVLARHVDHRADLFALGVIVYRSLTGTSPFAGSTMTEMFDGIVNDTPRRPSELADLPPALDLVMTIALAKRPADRFGSGAELADALERAARGAVTPANRRRAARLLRTQPYPTIAHP